MGSKSSLACGAPHLSLVVSRTPSLRFPYLPQHTPLTHHTHTSHTHHTHITHTGHTGEEHAIGAHTSHHTYHIHHTHITSHTHISDKHGCQYYLYWCHIPLNCFHQYFNNGCFLTELFLLNKSLRSYYWCRLVDGKNLALSIPLYILILQDPQLDFIRATANFPNWKAHDRIIFLGSLSLGVVMCWFWSRKRESDWYMSPSSSWWRSHSPWLTC